MSRFSGKVGKDIAGDSVINELQNNKVNVDGVKRSSTNGTATSYVVPSLSGDRTIFAYRGANTTLLKDDLPEKMIEESDFVYVTSLSNESAKRLPEIVDLAKKYKTKVSINPGSSQLNTGDSCIKDSLHNIDILILNHQESKILMHSLSEQSMKNISDEYTHLLEKTEYQENTFSLKSFFRKTLDLGPNIVVVTDGAKGVYVATKTTNVIFIHHYK